MAHMAYESAILAQGPRHRCWTDHRDFDPCDLRSRADLCSSYLSSSEIWWTWSGSNRRPLPCHGSALPTAPQAHLLKGKVSQNSLDTLNSRSPVGDSQTLTSKRCIYSAPDFAKLRKMGILWTAKRRNHE